MVKCDLCGDLVHDTILKKEYYGICYTCAEEVTLIQEPIELSPSDL